ncbi:GGDEF domain-containing protein [Polynucleobacter sp. AP-Sanab-80-C2]|uniref:GGDEF domain-containing protein n=1 Tax=Polynucleobacter sp. AP-Sanab-80-C2 TaxID=3108274 RepID=UPI002B230A75|nr:GGDEF domain-containing protein [Polynucleobacter sp. AP-Sanab-80-C2]MEA9599153.1 GGDEF domain-containing protein [Polynucleobacter sp. AP-Sanab-80-C2]
MEGLTTSYNLNGYFAKVSASIGVAIYLVDNVSSAYELIAHADEAMYKAKELGKNRSYFYC